MPRDLFGNVTAPFAGAGARSRYTVPLSLAAHTVLVATVVVIPLVASDTLPALRQSLTLSTVTAVVPPEPPRPRVSRPREAQVSADPNVAPLFTPERIAPEPPWQDSSLPLDAGSLIPGGIDDGLGVLAPPPPPPVVQRQEPVRIGGEVKTPAKTYDVAPVYPAIAQSARVQGVVIIQATIGLDGRVIDATVLRSVPLLDEVALAAVRQWRYTPSLLNGTPVAVIMTVTVHFTLR